MITRRRSDAPPPLVSVSEPLDIEPKARTLSTPPKAITKQGGRQRVLVVDDEPEVRRSMARLLLDRGFEALTAEDGAAAVALLATTNVDVMLVDIAMPLMSGLEVIERSKKARPDVEVIMMAGYSELDRVPNAIRAGAFGFVNKPPVLDDEVITLVTRAAEKKELVKRAQTLLGRAQDRDNLGEVIGQSRHFRAALRVAKAAARVNAPVLILGEAGVGKEFFARWIHTQSDRSSGPFFSVDCAAIPGDVLETELFGAFDRGVEGALFSGNTTGGFVERAALGTVFLDGVDALLPAAQAKLINMLLRPRGVDAFGARFIASATPKLRERVASGSFREDLFYRLATLLIEIPALRQRRDDIPLLAYHFVTKHAKSTNEMVIKFSVEALRQLREREWPGNVRELSSFIERAVILAPGDVIFPADLPNPSGSVHEGGGNLASARELGELPYPEAKSRVIDAFDRDYVERVLEGADGNISEAARRAGMDRSNFRRLLRKASDAEKARLRAGGAKPSKKTQS